MIFGTRSTKYTRALTDPRMTVACLRIKVPLMYYVLPPPHTHNLNFLYFHCKVPCFLDIWTFFIHFHEKCNHRIFFQIFIYNTVNAYNNQQ